MAGSELLVLNPRRRRARRKKARASAARPRRRRRVRRALFARVNPRRHRRVRASRRRRIRRNPGLPRLLGGNVGQAFAFAVGGLATEVAANYLADMLPAEWKTTDKADFVRIGTKAAIGIGAPMLLRGVLPRGWGNALAVGGTVVTILDIFKTFVAPNIPGLKLSGFEIGPVNPNLGTPAELALGNFDDGLNGSVYTGGVYS